MYSDNSLESLIISFIQFWVRVFAFIGAMFGVLLSGGQGQQSTYHPDILDPTESEIFWQHYTTREWLLLVGGILAGLGFLRGLSGQSDYSLTYLLVAIGLVLCAVGWYRKRHPAPSTTASDTEVNSEQATTPPLYVFTIALPQRTKWEPYRALQFMEYMLHYFDHLVFRIVADDRAISWQITELMGRSSETIEHAIRASYPDADVRIEPIDFSPVEAPFHRYVMKYSHANDFVMPMQYVTDIRGPDPLASLAQAMDALEAGERIVYTLIVVGANIGAYREGQRMITQSTIHPLQYLSRRGFRNAVLKKTYGLDTMNKYMPRQQEVFEEKLSNALYQAAFLVQIETPRPERIRHLALVNSQVALLTRYPFNALKWLEEPIEANTVLVTDFSQDFDTSAVGIFLNWIADLKRSKKTRASARLILEPRELALVWHLPHETCTASRIAWSQFHHAPVPSELARNTVGVHLGEGRNAGHARPVYLHGNDRVGHINIIGKTAVGKSTLLHHMVHQDIDNGEGVAVLDPHGTLIRDILQTSIPAEREKDVVLLDLGDSLYPPPLSPLRGQMGDVRIGQIVSIIERLFPDTVQYARLSRYLRAALGALQSDADATIRDLGRIFVDDDYRATLFTSIVSDDHFQMWQEYEDASEGEKRQIREPILSRISPFYGNPRLYPILCHPETLDFQQLIKERKIILISLKMDEEYVPEQERNLVGALLLSRLQLSGMQGAPSPYYIYIDEVQRFVTSSLDQMFSEARKFGLSLTVAHQFLGQLPEQTLEAILGNVGATIMFQCSPADAKVFGPYIRPHFETQDLVNLNKYHAAVKLQYKGITQPAFTLHTSEPLEKPTDALDREHRIRELSRQNYTPLTSSQVMLWLHQRYPRPKTPQPTVVNPADPNNFYDTK